MNDSSAEENNRLSRNFHETFVPERQYIKALLSFAASNQEGTYQEIRDITGIPMGKSTGKVSAILKYCIGMGLVTCKGSERSAIKKPELTEFGRIVFLEDPFLKEDLTQWVTHLNLCSPRRGADVWFQVFAQGAKYLGFRFSRVQLLDYLSSIYQIDSTKMARIIGPLVNMYQEAVAFKNCGALSEFQEKNNEGRERETSIKRAKAPIAPVWAPAYGAWLMQIISDHFPNQFQVTLSDLENEACFSSITGWDEHEVIEVLRLIENKKLIEVNRHMKPWTIQPLENTKVAWEKIYNDLL